MTNRKILAFAFLTVPIAAFAAWVWALVGTTVAVILFVALFCLAVSVYLFEQS
jgi:hypothetical protein